MTSAPPVYVERLLVELQRYQVWATPIAPTRIEVADGTPGRPPRASSLRIVRFIADDARLYVGWCSDGSVIGPADDAERVARAIRAVVAS